MRPNIPAKRVIDRFVEYHKRPFTVKDVANDTGLHTKTVRNLLPQLVREGRIKLLLKEKDGNIYSRIVSLNDRASRPQFDWRPKLRILRQVYRLVERHGYSEKVARRSHLSRETVFRYLRILRAEGCIVKDPATGMNRAVKFNPVVRWYSEYEKTQT